MRRIAKHNLKVSISIGFGNPYKKFGDLQRDPTKTGINLFSFTGSLCSLCQTPNFFLSLPIPNTYQGANPARLSECIYLALATGEAIKYKSCLGESEPSDEKNGWLWSISFYRMAKYDLCFHSLPGLGNFRREEKDPRRRERLKE